MFLTTDCCNQCKSVTYVTIADDKVDYLTKNLVNISENAMITMTVYNYTFLTEKNLNLKKRKYLNVATGIS